MEQKDLFLKNRCKGLADCHLHTEFSFDSEAKTEDMLARAEELELTACCITDHCEMNDPDPVALETNMKRSVDTVKQLRAGRFKDSKTVFLTGLEVGQGMQNLSETERFLKEIPVDFVIGSLHNIAGEEDFYFLEYTPESAVDLLDRYFDELGLLVEWGKFDSLGHLTYPLRYIVGKYGIHPDMGRYQKIIDELLYCLAKKEKALEINTSGLRNPIGETSPGIEYVKRFRELGGKYITIGSDAHDAENLGMGLREAVCIAKEAGFSHITYFVEHQPILIPILIEE